MLVSPFTEAPLLERDAEIAALRATLEAACDGVGRLVVVEGVAGVGKSRLLHATSSEASRRGMTIAHARGGELERGYAFAIVRRLFGPLVRALAPGEREALLTGAAGLSASVVLDAPGDASPAADPTYPVLHGLHWLLAGLCEGAPMLVVVDDVHWADEPSLRWLDYMSRRLDGLRAAVVLATRPATGSGDAIVARLGGEPHAVLPLRALSISATAELLRHRFAEVPDELFVAVCHDVSGGNPLRLESLARSLIDAGRAPTATTAAALANEPPEGIEGVVIARIRALGPAAARVAAAASVLQTGAERGKVIELTGLPTHVASEGLERLLAAGLLVDDRPLRFAHPLERRAAHDHLGRFERSSLHREAAALLTRDGAPSAQVAAHLLETEPATDPGVVTLLRTAAADARADGAPDMAASYLRRAVEEDPGTHDPALLLELGRAEASAGRSEAVASLRVALQHSQTRQMRAETTLALSQALAITGRVPEAVTALEETLAELPDDEPLRSGLLAALLIVAQVEQSVRPQLTQHIRWVLDSEPNPEEPAGRALLAVQAVERVLVASPAQTAVDAARAALGGGRLLAEQGPESIAVAQAANALSFAGQFDEAEATLHCVIEQAQAQGSAVGFALGSAMRAYARISRGDLRGAEEDADASYAAVSQTPAESVRFVALSFLIEARIHRGMVGQADAALADSGLHDAAWTDDRFLVLLRSRGLLRIAKGRMAAAIDDLSEIGRRASAWGTDGPAVWRWRSDVAPALLAIGDAERAATLVAEELVPARAFGAPAPIGTALRAAALVGGGDPVALLEEAVSVLDESGAELERARALVDLGAALRRAGRRTAARDQLAHGLDLADRCGAAPLVQRARDELRAAGAHPHRTRLHGVDALTASELRVARMAAEELTNREIAQALFVTTKAVEKHLSRAYDKLSIARRQELRKALGG